MSVFPSSVHHVHPGAGVGARVDLDEGGVLSASIGGASGETRLRFSRASSPSGPSAPTRSPSPRMPRADRDASRPGHLGRPPAAPGCRRWEPPCRCWRCTPPQRPEGRCQGRFRWASRGSRSPGGRCFRKPRSCSGHCSASRRRRCTRWPCHRRARMSRCRHRWVRTPGPRDRRTLRAGAAAAVVRVGGDVRARPVAGEDGRPAVWQRVSHGTLAGTEIASVRRRHADGPGLACVAAGAAIGRVHAEVDAGDVALGGAAHAFERTRLQTPRKANGQQHACCPQEWEQPSPRLRHGSHRGASLCGTGFAPGSPSARARVANTARPGRG
jgi:hypothetical protein